MIHGDRFAAICIYLQGDETADWPISWRAVNDVSGCSTYTDDFFDCELFAV